MKSHISLKLLFFLALIYVFLTQCDSVTNAPETDQKKEPVPNPTPALIIQLADTISGNQSEKTSFLISDYFSSDVPLISTEFNAADMEIEDAGSGLFVISQNDSLAGSHKIDALLVNKDSDTLKTSLTYIIEADSSAAADSSGNNDDSEDDGIGENDPDSGDNNDNENDDESDSGDPSDEDNSDDSGDDGNDSGENPDDGNDESEDENPTQPEPADLVIMPLGDSMTNDSRSRVKLWNLLEADGHSIDFVGNQYQQSSIPDADHEGVGGIKIHEVDAKIESLMKSHKPEYVNLMVGTNDMAWYFDKSAEEIAERWDNLVQKIYDHSAEGTFVIAATIPPVSPKNVGKSGMGIRDRAEMVKAFNREIRKLVQIRRDSGYNIVLADMEAALNVNEHVSGDGVHLTSTGYAIMGTVYYEAITSALK